MRGATPLLRALDADDAGRAAAAGHQPLQRGQQHARPRRRRRAAADHRRPARRPGGAGELRGPARRRRVRAADHRLDGARPAATPSTRARQLGRASWPRRREVAGVPAVGGGVDRRGRRRRRRGRPHRAAAPRRHRDVPGEARRREPVAWYDAGRDNASTDRLALLAELREALAGRDQLYLDAAARGGAAHRRPVSVEALVRWQHPRRGTLTPVDFVRAVEQSELLGQFTRYVLDAALGLGRAAARRAARRCRSRSTCPPRSLHDRQLPDDVGAPARTGTACPRERLILEITETVVLSEEPVVDEVLAELRALGVQLSVDDFGTGCSALTFLTRVAARRGQGRPHVRRPGWSTSPRRRRSCAPPSSSAASWAAGWWPRASRRPSSAPRWSRWAAPPRRASTSPSRCPRTPPSRRCAARRARRPDAAPARRGVATG